MTTQTDPYAHLSDPAEREWLTNLDPAAVRDNAHRFYAFMRESGVAVDSYTRELAFQKAAEALGISYDALYDAWLDEEPISAIPNPGWGYHYGAAGQPNYVTDDGPVWMFRKGQRVRFYNASGAQVGPEQANVAPAVAYAHSQVWVSARGPRWVLPTSLDKED